jgi:hypothetical protein
MQDVNLFVSVSSQLKLFFLMIFCVLHTSEKWKESGLNEHQHQPPFPCGGAASLPVSEILVSLNSRWQTLSRGGTSTISSSLLSAIPNKSLPGAYFLHFRPWRPNVSSARGVPDCTSVAPLFHPVGMMLLWRRSPLRSFNKSILESILSPGSSVLAMLEPAHRFSALEKPQIDKMTHEAAQETLQKNQLRQEIFPRSASRSPLIFIAQMSRHK